MLLILAFLFSGHLSVASTNPAISSITTVDWLSKKNHSLDPSITIPTDAPKIIINDSTILTIISYIAHPADAHSRIYSSVIAAQTLESISVLASNTIDVSLINNVTDGNFVFLKYPKSFRASLDQVREAAIDAIYQSENAMFSIHLNLKNVPELFEIIILSYTHPNDSNATQRMNRHLGYLKQSSESCLHEIEIVNNKILSAYNLINELSQGSMATQTANNQSVEQAKKDLEEYKIRNTYLEELQKRYQERLAEATKEVENAEIKFDEATGKMTDGFNLLLASLSDIVKNMSQMFAFGNAFYPSKSQNNANVTQLIKDEVEKEHSFTSKLSSNGVVNSLQSTAELLHNLYMHHLEARKVIVQEAESNRKEIIDIAIKISQTNTKKLTLKEIILYLNKALEKLSVLQLHWQNLKAFFVSLETMVVDLKRRIETFDQEIKGNANANTRSARMSLMMPSMQAIGMSLSLNQLAVVYNSVSEKFVKSTLNRASISITSGDPHADLMSLEKRLQAEDTSSRLFIEQELEKMQNSSISKITEMHNMFLSQLSQNNYMRIN